MELKLKDDTKNDSRDNQSTNQRDVQFSSNDIYDETQDAITPNPVVIKFDEVHAPIESRKNSHVGIIIKIIIFIILAAVLMIVYKNVIKPNFTTTDITDYVKSDETAIVTQLKLKRKLRTRQCMVQPPPYFQKRKQRNYG